ncbi:MAG: hypothetical protein BWK75_01195 [Candidatus Altiarchaeales archaeon A3]|nr:MAG: hypothetical protein BWK75_01195 [Candidatus Altiarchaeales archaeon A3]
MKIKTQKILVSAFFVLLLSINLYFLLTTNYVPSPYKEIVIVGLILLILAYISTIYFLKAKK